MIQALQKLTKIANIVSKETSTILNSALPVSIEVLEKRGFMRYMLKIGNIIMETKSLKELEIGSRYFAELQKSSVGSILIQNLIKQPKVLEDLKNTPIKFDEESFKKLFDQKKDPAIELKEIIVDGLVNAKSADDFNFFSNMLLALQKDIIAVPFKDESKDALLQFKRPKRGGFSQNFLEFYAIFEHLGSLNGKIMMQNEALELYLAVQYESVKRLLENEAKNLVGFEKIEIFVEKEIEPFFEFKLSLLDVRG